MIHVRVSVVEVLDRLQEVPQSDLPSHPSSNNQCPIIGSANVFQDNISQVMVLVSEATICVLFLLRTSVIFEQAVPTPSYSKAASRSASHHTVPSPGHGLVEVSTP